jgi:hypothetical protein
MDEKWGILLKASTTPAPVGIVFNASLGVDSICDSKDNGVQHT